MTASRADVQSVVARNAGPVLFSSLSNPTVSLTPLNATLTRLPATIANKRLTETLSPLAATLTKKPGGAVDTEAVLLES